MKYKVGDKVKVRQDLIEGEIYGGWSWNPHMACKYITINTAERYSYGAETNGRQWYYTDEMLDGLADEPVKELTDVKLTEEPTDAELIAAAEMLKANCEKIDGCRGCVFTKHDLCGITHCLPHKWEIPHHRKTRKELLLEKFPNADVQAIINIMCPGSFGISDRRDSCQSNYDDFDCEACWNTPVESEEE